MTEQPTPRPLPAVVIRLVVEASRAEFWLEGIGTAADSRRLSAWILADHLRHAFVVAGLSMAQPLADDLEDDALLAELAAVLGPPPAEVDPYAAVVPVGSLQGWTLRALVDRLEPERLAEWFRWATSQPWPHDPVFAHALRLVAAREGIA